MSYDRADFDYSTEAAPLPKGRADTHIGMFLAWAALNGLESDFHRQRSAEPLARLRRREITGRQFFEAACKERFSDKDLGEEGNAFAQHYYVDEAARRLFCRLQEGARRGVAQLLACRGYLGELREDRRGDHPAL